MRIRAIQEPVFSVANTDFEGGDDDHGYGDCIFLVIYAQPSHIGISCPGIKTQGVLKTLSACLLGSLGSAFRIFSDNTKEKMASIPGHRIPHSKAALKMLVRKRRPAHL